jgi:NAD(P)-dependent dehydrogenase (short-subunit alcohol dehydrogenase family)
MIPQTVALITGANKGIGLEIARQLGKQGMVVVLGARDEAKGAAATVGLRQQEIDAYTVKLDVTNQDDVAKLPGYFQEKFGRLDVLVNNAGVAEGKADDVDFFRRTFDANVIGVVAVTYALLPLLKQSSVGRIVNQSSILGSLTSLQKKPEMFKGSIIPADTASKAALNGFTVALAHKLRGTALKLNSAHPGWVQTDMGGPKAPMKVEGGAKTAVALATLPSDGPSGQFFHHGRTLALVVLTHHRVSPSRSRRCRCPGKSRPSSCSTDTG